MEKNHLKKYRLIREYPGSPKLGTEISCTHYQTGNSDIIDITLFLGEFWEEVVEKDYQILQLALAGSYNHRISDVSENSDRYINSLLASKGNYIHSIKRLSDGEIFTIGDKFKALTGSKEIEEIQSFEILDGFVRARMYHTQTKGSAIRLIFEDPYIERYKTPLFTTEDGVDIYSGDYCSHVNISDLTKRARTPYNTGGSYNPKTTKYFSTEEKAEEYILMNKPCLSIQDVLDSYSLSSTATFDNLKTLVKERL